MEMSRRHHHRHSMRFEQRTMRGDPEGDSILHKKKYRVAAPNNSDADVSTDSGVSSLKRRKQHHGYDDYRGPYKKNKPRRTYSDSDLSTLDITDTPDSLSQISAIAPVSDISTVQTTFSRLKPARSLQDTTWENAVSQARGEPDGAEKSFHKKRSKTSMKEVLATVPEDESLHSKSSGSNTLKEQENSNEVANRAEPVSRKKSIRGQLRKAASVLKKAKSRPKLVESKVGVKRKLDSTLADETMTKKPPMKELSKKERKQVRKTLKSNYAEIQRSKKIWEELRRQNTSAEKKNELCNELMNMTRGNMKQFCYAHDTARVIQCLIQFGSLEQREQVFEELKDEITTMAQSKYAKHLVRKLLIYGTKQQRNSVYKSFHGHVRKLIRHRYAADILEYAYNEYANASQRLALLEDFYGPSYTLFKTPDIKCLGQIMLSQPDKREMILRNMREALLPLIDKTILNHSMVHKVFMEFFTYADKKMRAEMIEALRESVIHMLHTRDGARVAMQCVWHGTTKDRKCMVKSMKGNMVKICKEEYGHLVLLAVFDSVDDTRIVKVVLLEEMLKSLDEVIQDQYGRKVIMYLLSPRDPHHFHPDIVRVLQEGDQNAHSKKDKAQRRRELLEVVSEPMLQYLVDNMDTLVLNNNMLLIMLGILTHALGDPTEAMEAVARIASEPMTVNQKGALHIVENAAGHMTLKKLIQNDRERTKQGCTGVVAKIVLFSEVLLRRLPEGSLKSWAACNRGCFTLVVLLELENPSITRTVATELKGVKHSLSKMTFKGAQVLLQKLQELWTYT